MINILYITILVLVNIHTFNIFYFFLYMQKKKSILFFFKKKKKKKKKLLKLHKNGINIFNEINNNRK